MPHSSGGGSHRSGSHSGHSSSHRSSSHRSSSHRSSYRSDRYRNDRYRNDRYRNDSYGSGESYSYGTRSDDSDSVSYIRVSKTPYPGAYRFRYYHNGSYRYVYSTQNPGKCFQPARLLLGLVYLPFLAIGVSLFFFSILPFVSKPKTYDIVIKDEAGVLDPYYGIESTLAEFRDKTGVTPAIITVNNETWQKRFDSLENYALSRYTGEFSDESHWLLVYSEPVTPDPEFNDWYWEGIQGDNTDSVITPDVSYDLTKMVQYSLEEGYNLTDVLENAFEEATRSINVYKPSFLDALPLMIPGLFILAFVCFHAYFTLGFNELKYRNAELDPEAPENFTGSGGRFGETPAAGTPQQSFDAPYGAQQSVVSGQPFGLTGAGTLLESEMPSLDIPQRVPEPQPIAMPSVLPASFPSENPAVFPAEPPVAPPAESPAVSPVSADPARFGDLDTDVCRRCGMRYVRGIRYCPGCGVSLDEFRQDDLNQ